jgi:hypothetical protein
MSTLREMFRSLLSFLALLIVLVFNTAHGHEQPELNQQQKEEKVYITPEQIEITEDTIVIWSLDGKAFFLTDSLALSTSITPR